MAGRAGFAGDGYEDARGYSMASGGINLDDFGEDDIGGSYFEDGADQEQGNGFDNDNVPTMSTEFYDQVETFLSKPPPSIGESLMKGGGSGKKKKKGQQPSAALLDANNLPLPPISKQHNVAVTSKGPKQSSKAIDPQLLRDAFAFTDQLLRAAVLEEAAEAKQQGAKQQSQPISGKKAGKKEAGKPPSGAQRREVDDGGGVDRDYLFYGPSAGGASGKMKNAPVQVVRSLKKNRQQQQGGDSGGRSRSAPKESAEFSIRQDEEQDLRRNPVNFEDLVANFQNGTSLQRLRKELEDSQSSLAQSSQAIRSLSNDFFSRR